MAPRPAPSATDPGWRVCLAETTTGRVVADLPMVGNPAWLRELNGKGSLSSVAVPLSPRLPDFTVRALAQPWRYTVLLAWGGWIAQAGMVTQLSVDDTQQPPQAQITCATVWEFLSAKRIAAYYGHGLADSSGDIVFGPTSTDPANQAVSWGGVARRLVEIAIGGPGCSGPGSPPNTTQSLGLPIVLPDPAKFPGTATITYAIADQGTTGERLADTTTVAGGCELEFDPQWTDDSQAYFQWELRVSDSRLGQMGYPHYWDYGKALQYVQVVQDGTAMTFLDTVKGSDTRQAATSTAPASGALAWGYSADVSPPYPGQGWPNLITADASNHSSETSNAILQSYADQAVMTNQVPTYTASATFRLDALTPAGRATSSPTVEALAVGDTAVIGMAGHPILPDGQTAVRLLNLANGQDGFTGLSALQVIATLS